MIIKNFNRIHLVGIGGISMSALAQILHSKKHIITGTNNVDNSTLHTLRNLGINISTTHNPDYIKLCNLVVYSSAIPNNHPDLVLAKTLRKPILNRAEFLSLLSSSYHNIISVSGTHGKTTTTAMLDYIFSNAQLKPTTHIGGIMNHNSQNFSLGSRKFFITEACEYQRSLLHLHPNTSIITNIEPEHMDCYHNFDEVLSTFQQFTHQTKELIIVNGDLPTNLFTPTKGQQMLTFGFNNTYDCYPTNIQCNNGKYIFDCIYFGKNLGQVRLNIFGKHNILNALSAIATSLYYNIHFSIIQSALSTFSGVDRRFNILHQSPYIIHDYAHHPTEIKHAILTAKSLSPNPLTTIFQPHTYSRTLTLMKEFSTAFQDTDNLIILPTYPSREMPLLGGDAIDLFYNVLQHNPNTTYCQHTDSLFHILDDLTTTQDTLLFLGAGTIDTIANQYLTHHTNQN